MVWLGRSRSGSEGVCRVDGGSGVGVVAARCGPVNRAGKIKKKCVFNNKPISPQTHDRGNGHGTADSPLLLIPIHPQTGNQTAHHLSLVLGDKFFQPDPRFDCEYSYSLSRGRVGWGFFVRTTGWVG